jgi:uroporphyrinogen decarboxylase
MRQAGRYLPEYRATRAKAGSFLDLCHSPSFCAEVLLQPLDRYDLDAAILFSDILTVPDAMGLGLSFGVGEGPRFAHPLRDEAAVKALAVPDMVRLQYVSDAVAECKRALTSNGVQRVPLIGFSGSPFTLACYMIEGGGSGDGFPITRRMLLSRPDLFRRVLDINVDATAYQRGQCRPAPMR